MDSQRLAKLYSEAPDERRKTELRIQTLTKDMEHLKTAYQHLEKELAVKQDDVKLCENKLHVSVFPV
jgi:chaperonin cofactor prefoldin